MVENRGNFRSSEIPISLFETAYNALEAKYKTAFNLVHPESTSWKMTEIYGDEFLFVGSLPSLFSVAHEASWSSPQSSQKNIIDLTMSRRGEFTVHTFNTKNNPSLLLEHRYLALTKTHNTATRRPDYDLGVLEVDLEIRSILNPREEMPELTRPEIVRIVRRIDMMALTEEDKESFLKDLIQYVPSWTKI